MPTQRATAWFFSTHSRASADFIHSPAIWRVLRVTIAKGKIVQADIIADPARLRGLDLAMLERDHAPNWRR